MKESRPVSPPEGRRSRWDTAAIGEALNASPTPRTHVAFGPGIELVLGEDGATRLELYGAPGAGLTRITRGHAEITLYHQRPPQVSGKTIAFEDGEVFTSLSSSGEVTLLLAPPAGTLEPLERPRSPVPPPPGISLPPGQEEPAVTHPSELSEGLPQPLPQPVAVAEGEDKQRVAYSGRVGTAPTFRLTDKGLLIAKFPLAVKQVDDTTVWHQVVVFGERARKLQDGQLSKGDRVDVIGYVHEREVQGRDGKVKKVEEVYAAVIKRPGSRSESPKQ